MTFRKITPVLIVDRIEPVIPFWAKLGAVATVEVPDATATDGRLGFVILVLAGMEIMYQTLSSVTADLVQSASVPSAFPVAAQLGLLFIEVDALDAVESALRDTPQVMGRRTTFYGSSEIGYADPAGNIVIFAEHPSQLVD
jgi:hypothetical protein